MTRVAFELDTGRLRLDPEAFAALSDWAADVETAGPAMDELRVAGVIDDGHAHPILTGGLTAVGQPVCRLRADLRDQHGATETAQVWVSAQPAAGLLLPLPDGLGEFITLAPVFVPVVLARLVELGPRPRLLTGPVPATEDLIARLTAGDPDTHQGAVAELVQRAPDEPTQQAVDTLASGLRRDWAIRAAWEPPHGGLDGRMLRVLDTTNGLWMLQPQHDPTAEVETIWPTTPTTVWRYLTRLLPDDNELG